MDGPTANTAAPVMEPMLNMTEAAKALGISYATILRWMKSGYIGYKRSPSGRKRITLREIERIKTAMSHEATNDGETF